MNDPELIEEVTKAAFKTKSEEFRIEALRILHEVDYPVASTLLHFGYDSTLYGVRSNQKVAWVFASRLCKPSRHW